MKAKPPRASDKAFTLLELLIALVVIVVIAALLLPALSNGPKPRQPMCMSNLKQVELAIWMWTDDHSGQSPWQVSAFNGGTMESIASGQASPHFQVLAPYFGNRSSLLVCPSDKTRKVATNADALDERNVSYFINFDTTTNSAVSVQLGDRHLEVSGQPVRAGLLTLTTNLGVGWTRELHYYRNTPSGCLAFTDGHSQVVRANLKKVFQHQEIITNRLAIP